MSQARDLLHTALLDGLPADEYSVRRYARDIDPPNRTTVMVRVDRVQRHPQTPSSHRRYTFAVIILGAKVDPTGPADEELDDALEDVLHVIELDPVLPQWTEAVRAVYGRDDGPPCYEVTVPVDGAVSDPTDPDPTPDPTP